MFQPSGGLDQTDINIDLAMDNIHEAQEVFFLLVAVNEAASDHRDVINSVPYFGGVLLVRIINLDGTCRVQLVCAYAPLSGLLNKHRAPPSTVAIILIL